MISDEDRFRVGQTVRHTPREGHFTISFPLTIEYMYVIEHDEPDTDIRAGMLIANCYPAGCPDDSRRGFALSELTPID